MCPLPPPPPGSATGEVNTVELVKEDIIQEQLLNTLTPAVRVWVKERKPKIALEAGLLADDYAEARRQSTKDDQVISVPGTSDLSGRDIGVETIYLP